MATIEMSLTDSRTMHNLSETRVHPTEQSTDALVIFGITGDLARKMTLRSLYRLELARQLNCPIFGVAQDDWSRDHLVSSVREALEVAGDVVDEKVFKRLARSGERRV